VSGIRSRRFNRRHNNLQPQMQQTVVCKYSQSSENDWRRKPGNWKRRSWQWQVSTCLECSSCSPAQRKQIRNGGRRTPIYRLCIHCAVCACQWWHVRNGASQKRWSIARLPINSLLPHLLRRFYALSAATVAAMQVMECVRERSTFAEEKPG
jgi:hypothetical protein